ncbi:MAG: C10 family peptidase [Holosporales bacterium]|jgi:hypothetical protein|nr:C10 family peptidase [Holosporales bacterium]
MMTKKIFCFLVFSFWLQANNYAYATFVDRAQALTIVENWLTLNHNSHILDQTLGNKVDSLVFYENTSEEEAGYYIVFLDPSGWVIVPSDDRLEPIIAFGDSYLTPELYLQTPLKYLLKLKRTLKQDAKALQSQRLFDDFALYKPSPKEKRWNLLRETQKHLRALDYSRGVELSPLSNDIVVSPLLHINNWGQADLAGSPLYENETAFYNYHTAWNGKNYLVGCAPLAVSQILRYNQYPVQVPRPPHSSDITVDGNKLNVSIIRTDRAYNWELMDIAPQIDVYGPALEGIEATEEWHISPETAMNVRDEIATLLHDTGVLLNADYKISFGTEMGKIWSNDHWIPTGLVSVDHSGTGVSTLQTVVVLRQNFLYRNTCYVAYPMKQIGKK